MVTRIEHKGLKEKRMFDLNEFSIRNYIKDIVDRDNIHLDIHDVFTFVSNNREYLQHKKIYELCVMYGISLMGFPGKDKEAVQELLNYVDRKKLLECGDPLPDKKLFILYRGIGDIRNPERIRGLAWTDDVDLAGYFAYTNANFYKTTPAVYKAKIKKDYILYFLNRRKWNEREFVVTLPSKIKFEKMKFSSDEISKMHKNFEKQKLPEEIKPDISPQEKAEAWERFRKQLKE